MLKVGSIGFGGGSALIPVMERELVNERGGLSDQARKTGGTRVVRYPAAFAAITAATPTLVAAIESVF